MVRISYHTKISSIIKLIIISNNNNKWNLRWISQKIKIYGILSKQNVYALVNEPMIYLMIVDDNLLSLFVGILCSV